MEITNNKKVIIINGKGAVGKDTFVKMVQKAIYRIVYQYCSTFAFASDSLKPYIAIT